MSSNAVLRNFRRRCGHRSSAPGRKRFRTARSVEVVRARSATTARRRRRCRSRRRCSGYWSAPSPVTPTTYRAVCDSRASCMSPPCSRRSMRSSRDMKHCGPLSSWSITGHPQIGDAPTGVLLAVIDLAGLPETEREPAARQQVRELASRPFDLERDLQLRASLIRLAEHDHVLVLVSHHIVSDGWSWQHHSSRTKRRRHEGFCARRAPAALPPLALQYTDYAAWQRQALSGQHLEALLKYWRARLAGASTVLDLPTDRPRPGDSGVRWGMAFDQRCRSRRSRRCARRGAAAPDVHA